MKTYKYYLLSFLLLGCVLRMRGADNPKLPPVNLHAKRIWIDQVYLDWGQPTGFNKKSSIEKLPWKVVSSFHPKEFAAELQANPASDGEFIYVASWSSTGTSTFYQYDMNGKYLDQFKIEGLIGSVRDMAFDGKYFYGGVQDIDNIFVMDFKEKKVVRTIPLNKKEFPADPSGDNGVRHVAYIPILNNGQGGLEIGSSFFSTLIDMQGNRLVDSALHFESACFATSYHKGYIYAFLGRTITEYDATTFKATGRVLNFNDFQGSSELPGLHPSNYSHGMEFIESPNGRMLALCGFQGGPNFIVKMEIERAALPNGMLGYNIYRNGAKINSSGLESNALEFIDKNIVQGVDYTYAVKAVYQNGESEAATTTIEIKDTRRLPFFENFSSYYFKTAFWTKHTEAWSHRRLLMAGTTNKYMVMADYNGFLRDTVQKKDDLVSRPLTTLGKNKVLLRYQSAMQIRHPKCNDTLLLEIFDGEQWYEVDRLIPVYSTQTSPLQHRTFDVSDRLADKENIALRFRVIGKYGNPSYDFFIKEVKLWTPDEKHIAGTISKEGVIPYAEISFVMNNDVITYTAQADADGKYDFPAIETGTYTVFVRHEKYNELVINDFIVNSDNLNVNFELKQPKIVLNEKAINIKMSPNKTMRYTLPLTNRGDGDGTWISAFEFPKEEISRKKGEQNEYKWDVITSFDLKGNVEDKIMFHKGYIRTLFTGGKYKLLMKYSKFGDFLGVDTLPQKLPFISNIVSDDNHIYFLSGATPSSKLYRFDMEKKEVADTLSFPVKSATYATYDPVSDGFYVGTSYELYLIDRKGAVKKKFDIGTTAAAKSIALDTVTANGSCLWIYGTRGVSGQAIQGESMGIYQFSLDSNKYTGVAHTPNDFSGYIPPVFSKRQSCEATSMVGSYDYFNGKFVLIGSLKYVYNGNLVTPSQIFVYDMGQSVKWIDMESFRGVCKAGKPLDYVLNFNTEASKQGDCVEASVRFNFVPLIEDFIVPIRLTVDTSIDAKCFVPSNLQTTVYSDEYVDLTFEIKDHDGSIVDESELLGFNIRRNGIKLNDSLIANKYYRDSTPAMGINRYSVQAVYKFNCESYWSVEDSVNVVYVGTCNSVKNIDLKVSNQRHLTLTWNAPENEVAGIVETFESYEAFSIDNIGKWELRDLDRAATYGFEQARFPHSGEPMSFIVFNPKKTRPAAPVQVFQGEQVLACFSTRVNGLANNDWLISPELSTTTDNVVFNFMAKTHASKYALERIRVGYSMTGKAEGDFIWFNQGNHYSVPEEWTEYSFPIPVGTKYVVINCVTVNSFMLLLDNLYIGAPKQYFSLKSYQLWRNDEQFMHLSAKAIGINDFALNDDTYKYQLVAEYTNGCVSPKSTPVEVEINMTNQTNPVRNLRGEYIPTEKAIKIEWSAPSGSDPQILKYHTDSLAYGFGLVGDQPAPFYVAAAFVGKDLTFEMDYSFTGMEIGVMDSCKVTAFVMCEGEFLTKQVLKNIHYPGFTTVSFDNPVKIDVTKTYLVGYKVENYKKGGYPAGTDNGPLVKDKGNFISMDGANWITTTELWGDEFAQNWNISAIIEIVNQTKILQFVDDIQDAPINHFNDFQASHSLNPDLMISRLFLKDHIQSMDLIVGYQLYKDGKPLHDSPVIAYSYKDEQIREGDNKYYVVTTYQNAGKIASDTLNVLYSPINIAEDIENGLQVSCKDKVITIQLTNNAKYSIAIHDLNGSLVERKENILSSQTEFFMNNRPQGTYMVVITQGSMQICRKVVVM